MGCGVGWRLLGMKTSVYPPLEGRGRCVEDIIVFPLQVRGGGEEEGG